MRSRYITPLTAMALFGAEGEGEDTPPTPAPKPVVEETPPPESFDAEYVKGLREENKQRRLKEKELADKLAEFEKANLSDLEKARTDAEEARAEAVAAKNALRTANLHNQAYVVAAELKFRDPEDAVRFLVLDDVDFDENGRASKASVKKQLAKVAEQKPYLLTATGSGDGGPASPPPPAGEETPEAVFDARVAEYAKQFEARGMVPRYPATP